MNDATARAPARWLLALLTLGLLAALLFVFRDFVRQQLLIPIYYAVWLGGLLLRSLDQSLLWAMLLGSVGVIALVTVLRNLRGFSRADSARGGGASAGRVSFWARQIAWSARADYFHEESRRATLRLVCAVLANQNRLPLEEVEARLQNGELGAPPEVLAFLQGQPSGGTSSRRSLWRSLRSLMGIETPSEEDDPGFVAVVQFLEDQLEGKHGNPSR